MTPVTREADGYVALIHYNSNGASVKMPDGTVYTFVPKLSISLAWVHPDHVGSILAQQARVCCGRMQPKFMYAPQGHVCLWETGHRC